VPVSAASKADKSHKRFSDALRNLLDDAPVESQSGFVYLMRIKSRSYTDGVFPKLVRRQAVHAPW